MQVASRNDEHLLTLLRYVECNPLRANLLKQAEEWPWSTLWHRCDGANFAARRSKGPAAMPED